MIIPVSEMYEAPSTSGIRMHALGLVGLLALGFGLRQFFPSLS